MMLNLTSPVGILIKSTTFFTFPLPKFSSYLYKHFYLRVCKFLWSLICSFKGSFGLLISHWRSVINTGDEMGVVLSNIVLSQVFVLYRLL